MLISLTPSEKKQTNKQKIIPSEKKQTNKQKTLHVDITHPKWGNKQTKKKHCMLISPIPSEKTNKQKKKNNNIAVDIWYSKLNLEETW